MGFSLRELKCTSRSNYLQAIDEICCVKAAMDILAHRMCSRCLDQGEGFLKMSGQGHFRAKDGKPLGFGQSACRWFNGSSCKSQSRARPASSRWVGANEG